MGHQQKESALLIYYASFKMLLLQVHIGYVAHMVDCYVDKHLTNVIKIKYTSHVNHLKKKNEKLNE